MKPKNKVNKFQIGDNMLVVEVIPIKNNRTKDFKEKIKLTKELKGKVEILDNCIMVSQNVKKGIDRHEQKNSFSGVDV